MKRVNEIINEIGISKVKLAKYLGVSRQMVYNYLEMDDINNLPLEKKMKLFTLLKVSSQEEIEDIKVDSDFIKHANSLINEEIEEGSLKDSINFAELDIKDQRVLNDIIFLLKERLIDDESGESSNVCKYLYYFLQAIDHTPEIKYMIGYVAKTTGFVDPNEFVFEKNNQFEFESILFSAMVLYSNHSASKERLIETHKKFEHKIYEQKEEQLSRTQELITAQDQALKELGYKELNKDNSTEVLEKMAEIQSRQI